MDGNKIHRLVSKLPLLKTKFLGCFPSDRLPSNVPASKCFIANFDFLNSEGTHWVALIAVSENNFEYFDSFGRKPPDAFYAAYENITYNKSIVQSLISDNCGYFCIFYLLYRCKGFSMSEIVSFLDSKANPDFFVENFINKQI